MPFISETQRSFLERQHPDVYARFVRDERRMGFELKAPPEVAAIAKRGLALREEHKRGGTVVGATRANQLAKREVVSIDTIKRMVAYFTRHEVDLQAPAAKRGHPDYPSAGYIAWLLWGGDAGRSWARKIVRQQARIEALLKK